MQRNRNRSRPVGPATLEPDPVIEAYKKDIDRTLLRANLALSQEQRGEKFKRGLALVVEIRKNAEPNE